MGTDARLLLRGKAAKSDGDIELCSREMDREFGITRFARNSSREVRSEALRTSSGFGSSRSRWRNQDHLGFAIERPLNEPQSEVLILFSF